MPNFRFLKMAAVRHVVFLKVGNFNCGSHMEGQCASSYQIFCRSVKPLRRYGWFSIFHDGGRPPSWNFKNSTFGQTVPEIWSFFDCWRWRPSANFYFKVRNINFRSDSKSQCPSPCQISCRSVKPLRTYGRFWNFSRWQQLMFIKFYTM